MSTLTESKTITAVDLRQAAAAFLLAQFKQTLFDMPQPPAALIAAAQSLVHQL